MEADFNAFDIEHSTDARQFERIGTVPGANAGNGAAYSFTHSIADEGIHYYRLKMNDIDASFRYSKIVSVDRGGERAAESFVRPSLISTNALNVVVDEPFHTVEVVNAGGQVVLSEKIGGRSGTLSIPLGDTTSGIYIVRMAGHDRIVQQKVLVTR